MPGEAGDSVENWFLTDAQRGNSASDLRGWTSGNTVEPLVDGAEYFPRLHEELCRTQSGDQVYLADFRGDTDELLAGPGTSIGDVLVELAGRGVTDLRADLAFAARLARSERGRERRAGRTVSDAGGEVLLDSRTRRAGSHHQKFVVIRHPGRPEHDIAFVGGIDLGHSRHDDRAHAGDPQAMEFPSVYGPAAVARRPGGRPRPGRGRHRAHLSGSGGTAAPRWTCPARCGC